MPQIGVAVTTLAALLMTACFITWLVVTDVKTSRQLARPLVVVLAVGSAVSTLVAGLGVTGAGYVAGLGACALTITTGGYLYAAKGS